MKFNWKAAIKDFVTGDDIKEGDRVITVGIIACRALDATLPNETAPTTDVKLDRWDLMLRIRDGGEIDKSEIKLIEDRIGQAFSPSIVGACHAVLKEPAPPKKANE